MKAVCDILAAPLFTFEEGDAVAKAAALPDLLARLIAGPQIARLPAVAAAQRGQFWRFMVRCAAKSLHELGVTVDEAAQLPPDDLATRMRKELRTAAGDPDGSRGVWSLYQPDPAQPGFMQPPTPDGTDPPESYARNTLSSLTSAIGSKNHERKNDSTPVLGPEETFYALLDLQMGAIFGGRGNYGSQLMGSASGAGSGSPFMGARIGSGENETFRHDTAVLLESWDMIAEELALRGPVWALWAEKWDGTTSLPSSSLDPAFIPVARLVRLGPPTSDGAFDTVWFRPTIKARVQDLTGGGNMGDPFTPLIPDAKSADLLKVRGTLEGGYDYREVMNLLFGVDPKRPARPSPSARALVRSRYTNRPDVRVVFEGTAFEQGKTVGFHRREVLLPGDSRAYLNDSQPLRQIHGELMERVRRVKSALNGAGRVLLAGVAKPREGDGDKIAASATLLETAVDSAYLGVLLDAARRSSDGDDSWRAGWAQQLSDWALAAFHDGMAAIPRATARRYEREVHAWSWLHRQLREVRAGAGGAEGNDAPLEHDVQDDSELEETEE